jgi:heterodisulfide reductase subunit A
MENVWSYEYLNMCTDPGADFIIDEIKDKELNRVVVAACTPRTHQPVFHNVLHAAGLPPRMLEFVNIREHCSYVHMEEPEIATRKAIELIKAGIARARLLEDVPTKRVPVAKSALIVGGGIAGLTAGIDLANEGFKVYIIEKKSTTGGRMAQLDRTFPTDDCSI